MEHYTAEQRLQIVKIYYKNNESAIETYRKLIPIFGQFNRPSTRAISGIVKRFEQNLSLHDVKPPTRARTARSEENIAAVSASVDEDPNLSIPRRAQQLNLSQTTTWRILRKDLGLHPYKIQLVQELKPQDHGMRRTFADWALEQLEAD